MIKSLLSVLNVLGWLIERFLTKKDKETPIRETEAAKTDSANENDISLNARLDDARSRMRDKNSR